VIQGVALNTGVLPFSKGRALQFLADFSFGLITFKHWTSNVQSNTYQRAMDPICWFNFNFGINSNFGTNSNFGSNSNSSSNSNFDSN
jgi:hypothetical protein